MNWADALVQLGSLLLTGFVLWLLLRNGRR